MKRQKMRHFDKIASCASPAASESRHYTNTQLGWVQGSADRPKIRWTISSNVSDREYVSHCQIKKQKHKAHLKAEPSLWCSSTASVNTHLQIWLKVFLFLYLSIHLINSSVNCLHIRCCSKNRACASQQYIKCKKRCKRWQSLSNISLHKQLRKPHCPEDDTFPPVTALPQSDKKY